MFFGQKTTTFGQKTTTFNSNLGPMWWVFVQKIQSGSFW
jgi:hypothetical protein